MRRLPATPALYLQASIMVTFLASSNAPTPLYAIYQARWGFSPITTTIVFALYAITVLLALLVVGRLSDHVGRRPILLVALAIQAVGMIVFATASDVDLLCVARIVQGLATGFAAGAVGAGMVDVDRERGTRLNALAPPIGTAVGGLAGGLFVQFLPFPTHLVYLVLLGVFVLQAVGVATMAETSSAAPGALASLRPELAIPPAVRRPMLAAVPMLVSSWAIFGFYGGLSPALIHVLSGSRSALLGSLGLAVLSGSAAVTVGVVRRASARAMVRWGGLALLVGLGLTLLAVAESSTALFFAGSVVAGIGFGAGFQGCIRTVVPRAAPHERSGVLSAVFVVSYLAMGLPAVVAGFLVVHVGGLRTTSEEYLVAAMVLAAVTLAGAVRREIPEKRPATAGTSSPIMGPSAQIPVDHGTNTMIDEVVGKA